MNRSFQRTQHNTYSYDLDPKFVTVTHPYHPLRGTKLELIKACGKSSVMVRLDNGSSLKLPVDYTDYIATVSSEAQDAPDPAAPLHSVDFLRRIISVVGQIKLKSDSI